MKRLCLLIALLLPSLLAGSELSEVVAGLKEPTVKQAKLAIADLDRLIAAGNARTVTLGKKMQRSIRRIYTSQYKILEAKKAADEQEARAKQLEKNGRKWLTPNVHGRINKTAARAAFEEAKTIRQKSVWRREELSREWGAEVADFEKMLGDLEFSKEDEALLTLAGVLLVLVERTPWVDRPPVNHSAERMNFLRNLTANKERWLVLARHASDANDYELAYDFFRKAGSDLGRFRVGAQLAAKYSEGGFVGSTINIWERLGESKRAADLRAKHPDLKAENYQVLSASALKRNISSACVRVATVNGHQSGFFVKAGGYVATCKWGLRNQEQEVGRLRVILDDGRALTAKIVGESKGSDIALLKIEHEKHELLPIAVGGEVKSGDVASLFGFADGSQNAPGSSSATVLASKEEWRGQKVMRLALDAGIGNRGAPLVDSRGRVVGMFLTAKTGTARALEAGEIRAFVDKY